ncbi:TldD/PmbA family protein [Sphaerisporangium album]|uniref:TldD/PmbA family protein n=1 Tax=Sphaerisporangium album TaxID=509200 RepID=A0A367F527_9ACTN|nr:metallopeptidase TldD-related protein [Sphaerisporangium album]RCG25391.1 TldD/PmbA family protein [Sphaerisporangium album]
MNPPALTTPPAAPESSGTTASVGAEELLHGCRALLDAVAAEGGDAADVQCVSTSVRAVQAFADGAHAGRQGVTVTTGLRVRAGEGAATLLLGAPPASPGDVARLAVALARRSHGEGDRPLAPIGVGAAVHPAVPEPEAPFEVSRRFLAELLTPPEAGPVALGAEHVHTRSWTVVADGVGSAVAYEQAGHHAWHWLEGLGGHMVDGLAASRFDELRWDALAARAREFRAVHLAGPRPLDHDGALPVLLHPDVAAHLVRSLGFLLCAGNVLSGMRPLLERVGRRIASPAVTLADDPVSPVDAEGTPARRQVLLERGVLKGFLTGRANASELGVTPSGAARRSAPDQPAVESPSHISLAAGEDSRDALRARLGDGIEAVGVVQPGRIRGRRGTFTTVVLGWRVRDGRRTEALGPVRVSLGVFELLRSIQATADDPAHSYLAAGARSPSILLSHMRTG